MNKNMNVEPIAKGRATLEPFYDEPILVGKLITGVYDGCSDWYLTVHKQSYSKKRKVFDEMYGSLDDASSCFEIITDLADRNLTPDYFEVVHHSDGLLLGSIVIYTGVDAQNDGPDRMTIADRLFEAVKFVSLPIDKTYSTGIFRK